MKSEKLNSMVGYHLMAEGHSIQLGVWGTLWAPQQVQGSALVGFKSFWIFFFLNIGLKGALSGRRQFLATESPLKTMKNTFCFTWKALFVLKIFKFLFWIFPLSPLFFLQLFLSNPHHFWNISNPLLNIKPPSSKISCNHPLQTVFFNGNFFCFFLLNKLLINKKLFKSV